MKDAFKKRYYQNFNPNTGYPAGNNLFYECLQCGDIISSLPNDSITCKCGNIGIDVDYGRVSIKNDSLLKVFLGEL